jgi:hypothetical protein
MTELIPIGIAIVTVAGARRALQSVTDTVVTCPTCGRETNLGTRGDARVRQQVIAIALDHTQHATTS